MSYDVSYDEINDLVTAYYSGSPKIEEFIASREDIVNSLQKFECRKLLVNLINSNLRLLNVVDCYDFGKINPKVLYKIKVAVVLPFDESSKEYALLTSTVAYNRGLITEEFNTLLDALNWLNS